MTHFNSELSETENTFEKMLQSLRKWGIPFGQDEIARGSDEIVTYLYENLMELVLILSLRTRGYRVRDLAKIIIQHRSQLRKIFRRAYLERQSKLGAARCLYVSRPISKHETEADRKSGGAIELTAIRGTYLDLRIAKKQSGAPELLGLELLGPQDATIMMMNIQRNLYPISPLPISNMAEDLVRIANGPIPTFRFDPLTLSK